MRKGSSVPSNPMWGRSVRITGALVEEGSLRFSHGSCNTKGELKKYDEADDGHVGQEA